MFLPEDFVASMFLVLVVALNSALALTSKNM
jgi:hypothetical protein